MLLCNDERARTTIRAGDIIKFIIGQGGATLEIRRAGFLLLFAVKPRKERYPLKIRTIDDVSDIAKLIAAICGLDLELVTSGNASVISYRFIESTSVVVISQETPLVLDMA